MRSILPEGQFDGQIFIDAHRIKWVYDSSIGSWKKNGKVNNIPVANTTTTGLLSKELKYVVDKVHNKGGGYGIITKPFLKFRDENNPDGVIFGDVEIISDSLDIKCVHSDGTEIGDECARVCYNEKDAQPPGFDINFSDKFLRTLCIEVPGGPGLRGPDGDKGPDGEPGTGDGPKGLPGNDGEDATEVYPITGVRVVDVDDITNVAITNLEMDQKNGKLYATKGRIKVPDSEGAAASKFIVSQINRGIRWDGECWEYDMVKLPCGPSDDFDELDPTIIYYPSHFDPQSIDKDLPLQPVKGRLSDLIGDLVNIYQNKLDEVADEYDKEIEKWIYEKDRESRKILDILGDRLAECENITYLEYCIGLDERCIEPESGGDGGAVVIPGERPDCAAVADVVGAPGSDCQSLSTLRVSGEYAPVFSFALPDGFSFAAGEPGTFTGAAPGLEMRCPKGCHIRKGRLTDYVHKHRPVVPEGWTPIPDPKTGVMPVVETVENPSYNTGPTSVASKNKESIKTLSNVLKAGKVIYKKQQFFYQENTGQFPAGLYAFVYNGGSFKQEKRPEGKVDPSDAARWQQGEFQKYFLGNEGGGSGLGSMYILDTMDVNSKYLFQSELATTEIGLEIGFAPSTYKDQLPKDYFDVHKYDVNQEVGNKDHELPKDRVDFDGLTSSQISQENKIQWKKFPTAPSNTNFDDQEQFVRSYLDGPTENRVVSFETTQPGFFFARVKLAYSACATEGRLVMPPVEKMQLREASKTFANIFLEGKDRLRPVIDAMPITQGFVDIEVIKIDTPADPEPTSYVLGSPPSVPDGFTSPAPQGIVGTAYSASRDSLPPEN